MEVAGVVDQHVYAAEPFDSYLDGGRGGGGVGDVEFYGEEPIVLAQGRGDGVGVASGSDHSVAVGERGLGNVYAHATAGACDQPYFLVSHAMVVLLLDCGWGTAWWCTVY